MSDNTSNNTPPPLKILLGIVQFFCSMVLGFFGGLLRTFPVTTMLGGPLLKASASLAFHGGANFTSGIIETFGMIGRGISGAFTKDKAQITSNDQSQSDG